MDKDVENKIIYLYFKKMYNFDKLVAHFKKQYSKREIKAVTKKYIMEKGKWKAEKK